MTDTETPPNVDDLIAAAAAKHDEGVLAKVAPQAQGVAELLKGISTSPETAVELLTLRGALAVSEHGELLIRQGDELVQPSAETLRAALPSILQKAIGPSGTGTRGPREFRGRSGLDPSRMNDATYFREHRAEIMAARYGRKK